MISDADFTICIVGLGYIGLPTAAVVAGAGMRVIGVEVSDHVIDTVNSGRVHIEETDLDDLVATVVADGRLSATRTVPEADVFVIAVPTPFKEDHEPDISYVLGATRAISPRLRPGNLIILESTSPVGTTERMRDVVAELRPDLTLPTEQGRGGDEPLALAYCPERVLPGRILAELIQNDRIIGGMTPACAEQARAFYKRFVTGECIVTNPRTAEMAKLAENAFRDTNIAFANELSLLADSSGVDVWELIALANRHPRVNILSPGPGVGGHCIAVDPWFLVHANPEQSRLIRTAREVNDDKTDYVIDRASALIDAHPDAGVACLGLAFKANIDDFRESPALKVAAALAHRYGSRIRVVEPFADALPAAIDTAGSTLVPLDEALEACGVVIVLVDHDVFRAVPIEVRSTKQVLDTRGIWSLSTQ